MDLAKWCLHSVVLLSGLGLLILPFTPDGTRARPILPPLLGLGFISIMTPLFYKWGLGISQISQGFWILSAVGWLIGVIKFRAIKMAFRLMWGLPILALLVWPAKVSDLNFSLFQGNHWDLFGYLESAVVYTRESYSVISSAVTNDFLANPLWMTAQTNLGVRPTVHQVYAVLNYQWGAEIVHNTYVFMAFMLWLSYWALRFVFRNLRVSWFWSLLASTAFVAGFWGQYILDINAWSHQAFMPLIIVGTFFFARVLEGTFERRNFIFLLTLWGGAFFLYPEGYAFFLVAVLFSVLFMKKQKRKVHGFAAFLIVNLVMVALGAMHEGILEGGVRQVLFAGKERVSWWQYFLAYVNGRNGLQDGWPWNAFDVVSSIGGLYFLTPIDFNTVRSFLVGILGLTVLLTLWRSLKPDFEFGALRPIIRTLLGFVLLLLVLDRIWASGKALTYAMPLFYVATGVYLSRYAGGLLKLFFFSFFLYQISLGFSRIEMARAETPYYELPYVHLMDPPLKKGFNWETRNELSGLERCQLVSVEVEPGWYQRLALLEIYSRGVLFQIPDVVKGNFGYGGDLGAGTIRGSADCRVRAEGYSGGMRTLRLSQILADE